MYVLLNAELNELGGESGFSLVINMEKKKGSLFRYADGVDKLLMFFGTLGCIGDGLMSPVCMIILSSTLNNFGDSDTDIPLKIVNKYSLRLLYVAFVVGISCFIEGVCWTRTAERQTSRMRMEYLRSTLRQEVGFFDVQTGSSTTFEVISNISSDAHVIQDVIAEKIPNTLGHLTCFVFSLVVAFVYSWRLAVTSIPFSIMFVLPPVILGAQLMAQGMKMKDAYMTAGGIAEQAISSIRTVYSYVGESQTLNKFNELVQVSTDIGIKMGFMKGLVMGSMGMIFIAWAFISWVGSVLVTENGQKGGSIFISAICIVMGGISIMSVLPNLSAFAQATAAATRIMDMIDHIPAIDSEIKQGKCLGKVGGEIEFKGVFFSYPSRPDTPILQGLNLKVHAGKTVGLVGGSGSGKSTIISLLERFYDPLRGEICLDGRNIKNLQLKWLRAQMGLVNQEPILFATSIKENILFGKRGASMEQIVNAAKAANAHDFISKLPDAYETQVGQFGVQLSGGQKQRISIARALVRDPRILLLDEATSALDAESERIVQEALDRASQGRTTIIVAHRLSTIRNADMITVLQSGQVVEAGTHDELIRMTDGQGGAYWKMIQLQKSALKEKSSTSIHHLTESRNNYKQQSSPAIASMSVRSSLQSSPVCNYSPAISVSIAPSLQTQFDDDSDYEDFQKSSYPHSSQWRLLRFTGPEWKTTSLGCLGAVISGAVQPIYAYCLGTVVSIYFQDKSKIKSETRFYCYIFLGLGVINFISNLTQHYSFAVVGERLTRRVREKMLGKVLTFEIGWFDQDENTSAAICAKLAKDASLVQSLIVDRMSLLLQVFVTASLAFVLALLATWRVAIVVIAIQPLIIASFYFKSALMKSMSAETQKAHNVGNQLASEAVTNHRTITAFSSQKRILSLFEGTLKGPRAMSIRQSWISGIVLFSAQFLSVAAIAWTFWYGGSLMVEKQVHAKNVFQVFFILMTTGKHIADAGSMSTELAKGSGAVRSVFAILDRSTEIEPDNPEGKVVKRSIKGRIELKNIVFSYPTRPEQMIFRGFSLKIEAGKAVALVGQSGSGKSTIIGLIERFYDPIDGSILIDDENIKNYNLRSLRSHIALVSQEPTLFAGTIRENIIYGKDDATETEIRKAAMQANADQFISSMKDGYDTYCGERGVQLSGGQKQRIALARAILKNPAVLLLDEATSALDSASESLVQEALEKMMVNRTCIIVAHRLSTIQKSDTIAVIKNGRVAEKGSHSQLLSAGSKGAYYSLIKLQGGQLPNQ